MIIPDNLLKATLAEAFSNYLCYSPSEEARDFPEVYESWNKADNMLESDVFKNVNVKAREELQDLINNSTYEYQKQGFIQGFMYATKMLEAGKIFEHSEPLKEAQQNFNREING